MIFLLHLAFAAEIIALGTGLAFLVWTRHNKGGGQPLAVFSGYLITTLALIGMLCTTYYGLSYWFKGYFTEPKPFKLAMGVQDQGTKYAHGGPRGGHMMPGRGQEMPMEGMPSQRRGPHMERMPDPEEPMQEAPEEGHMMPGQEEHMEGMPPSQDREKQQAPSENE